MNSDEVGKRLMYFLLKMRQMKDILKKTAHRTSQLRSRSSLSQVF